MLAVYYHSCSLNLWHSGCGDAPTIWDVPTSWDVSMLSTIAPRVREMPTISRAAHRVWDMSTISTAALKSMR